MTSSTSSTLPSQPVATGRSFAAHRLFPVLRLSLRWAQRLGPHRAARVAAGVFCTPLPTKLAVRHLRPPAGVRVETLPFENVTLTLYRWPAATDAPVVLLTHGWGGWGLQMAALATALQQRGLAPVAVDQPGHGRSEGWQSTLAQFTRAVGYLGARLGPLHAVVGHSMGGAAALNAIARGLVARSLVTAASPTDLVQVTRDYAAAFGLAEATRGAMVQHIESREAIVFEQMSAAHQARRVVLPTLLVHDRDDRVVPVEESLKLNALLPDARLLLSQGLGHRRVLQDADVVEQVGRFIAG
ncbi:alpha/beta hydrolase [Caldimonas brevitalea]|uniref:Hydrolase n=1 Tax=Caldimonas brevitalea TaxID=413882 RepID=A0A0G3BBL9_9BURK|nr:alpha/beta fold hydrolase [Caldimonas brevitalea]AKJ26754.1 hydrolase [Caldimonas brevitalea]